MTRPSAEAPSAAALADLDRRYLFHPFTALADHERDGPPLIVRSAKGVMLEDASGARYIDTMAGLWCVNVGYGRAEIAEAMRAQAEKLCYFHAFSSMSSEAPILLAERLVSLAPAGMSKVFFGNSGSDANDTQVKIVWYYNNARGRPNKKKIIARTRGYHGVTVMSAGLTGLPGLHAGFDLPLPFVRHVKAPHRLWEGRGLSDDAFVSLLIDDLEALIAREGADTIGAMIVEPVMGAGGVIVPPEGYYPALQHTLKKHDILLIADEVICGFGRLGKMFGCDMFAIAPDLVTVAKGVTSAYAPLSAALVSEPVWRVLVEGGKRFGPFGHGYTYTAHPTAAAAALENLAILEREKLVARAGEMGALLHRLLREAFGQHPMVGETRGQGLIGAVEFADMRGEPRPFEPHLKVGPRVVRAMLKRGVVSRALPSSDSIAFSPPFVIAPAELERAVSVAREAADETFAELKREGAL